MDPANKSARQRSSSLIEGVLGGVTMFKQCTHQHLLELARHARVQNVSRGTVIVRRGEVVLCCYAIAYGMVKLALRTDSGEERVLRLAGPGETFAEAIMFLEKPSLIEALALSDTLLVALPAAAVNGMIERDAHFARGLVASLSQRLHMLVSDVEASALHGGLERVAAYLDAHAECTGGHTATVRLQVTKTIIASHLGITKETFSRLLRELASQSLIKVARREITILDRAGLVDLARGHARHATNRAHAAHTARADLSQSPQ